jgi:hypothetical protein
VPDGSWSAFSAVSGSGATIASSGRYLQYQLALATTVPGVTPVLRDIILTYQNAVAMAPSVASITTGTGPTTGNTTVTIVGTGFAEGATVSIGGALAGNVVVVSDTEITADTPEHQAGTVDVVVTNPDTLQDSLESGFTYEAEAPSVTSITPATGSTDGGVTVVITGTGFAAGATVTFGGNPGVDVVVDSSTKITVMTPAADAGTVDVSVTNNDGQTGTLPDGFTFEAP